MCTICGAIIFSEFFAAVHSSHLAVLPFLSLFFCDFVNRVSSGVFPQIAQAATPADRMSPRVPSVAGELWNCASVNTVTPQARIYACVCAGTYASIYAFINVYMSLTKHIYIRSHRYTSGGACEIRYARAKVGARAVVDTFAEAEASAVSFLYEPRAPPSLFAGAVVDTFAAPAASAVSFPTELEATSSLVEATTGTSGEALRLPDTLDQNKLLSKQCINDLMQGGYMKGVSAHYTPSRGFSERWSSLE